MAKKSKSFRTRISIIRSIKYGMANFIRNIWISLAAILVMSLTLLIVFLSVISNDILKNAISDIRQKVDMSIYLSKDTDKVTIEHIKSKIKRIKNVKSVHFISSEESRKEFISKNKSNNNIIEAINESVDKFPAIFRIKLYNIQDTSELIQLVKEDKEVKSSIDSQNPPSFMVNDSRKAFDNIGKYANFAEKLGIMSVILFTTIALLVMFNTIKMAIFNYKEEISMMKLIGAKKWFIRVPFLIEAMIDGLISSLIASGIGYYFVNTIKDIASNQWLVDVGVIEKTTNLLYNQWYFVILIMAFIGMIIGLISSLIATRKYLKFEV